VFLTMAKEVGTNDANHQQAEPITVPASGDIRQRNPRPAALSPTPFLGGWGRPVAQVVVNPPREELPAPVVEETRSVEVETLSAAGYLSLVESVYREDESVSRRVPFSLFQYYMVQAWWRNLLSVERESRELTSEEADALSVLEGLGDLCLPLKVADYFRVFSSGRSSGIKSTSFSFRGFIGVRSYTGFPSFNNSVRVDSETMWLYALFPVPGVALSAIFRDFVRAVSCGASEYEGFSEIRPWAQNFPRSGRVVETGNILCWRETGLLVDNLQLLDLLSSCGMCTIEDINRGFRDQSTNWLISPSLMSIVRHIVASSCLGVAWMEQLDQLDNWHTLQEAYIRVDQTRESMDEMMISPDFWGAYHHGKVSVHSDYPIEDGCVNYLYWSGFRASISFHRDDGTTNHSPWYVHDGDELIGPTYDSIANNRLLSCSRRVRRPSYPTYSTEAVRRKDASH